jgi:hypothetical protein
MTSGCTKVQTKQTLSTPSDSLLIHPCKAEDEFTTPRELMVVNKKNVHCIEQYKTTIDSLIDWKQKQQLIYKENK